MTLTVLDRVTITTWGNRFEIWVGITVGCSQVRVINKHTDQVVRKIDVSEHLLPQSQASVCVFVQYAALAYQVYGVKALICAVVKAVMLCRALRVGNALITAAPRSTARRIGDITALPRCWGWLHLEVWITILIYNWQKWNGDPSRDQKVFWRIAETVHRRILRCTAQYVVQPYVSDLNGSGPATRVRYHG